MSRFAQLVSLVLLAACSQEVTGVRSTAAEDALRSALVAAVDGFVLANRTPAAYADLARTIATLRPGAPPALAEQAELDLIVLALAPVKAVQARSMADQVDALALTVWPTLLGSAPSLGEDAGHYLMRLCDGPLASSCRRAVPELQGQIINAVVLHRAAVRARTAIEHCLPCGSESAWHGAALAWEELDRGAAESLGDAQRRAEPDNWPTAGSGALADPQLPEAELSPHGRVLVGDRDYGTDRIAVFRELRGAGDAIALHVHPETTVAQLRAALSDARRAGCSRVAAIAREPSYPWGRRIYWLADRADLRPTDSLARVFDDGASLAVR